MAKLTKEQRKLHQQAEDILKKDVLTTSEKEFVFENWNEAAHHNIGMAGAFFTPFNLALDFAFDVGGLRIIDLCAGIGVLAYAAKLRYPHIKEIVCIEQNYDYVAIGRKLLPEATWIHADVFDWKELNLGTFDCAISNPPFGKVKRSGNGYKYKGQEFEYHVISIASQLAREGVFIVPQMSSSFRYSARRNYERVEGRGSDFENLMGFSMETGAGVDTSFYAKEWKNGAPVTEIVTIDFEEMPEEKDIQILPEKVVSAHITPIHPTYTEQLSLF